MINPDDVTACIVTRGNVDLAPILAPLIFGQVIVWNNAKRTNRAVYGRYLAAAKAKTDYIYFQDDDVVVPEQTQLRLLKELQPGMYVCNHPREHNQQQFPGLHFIGWGTVCERTTPPLAFARWREAGHSFNEPGFEMFGCDIVFSLLTPHLALDLGQEQLSYAYGSDRTYRQRDFQTIKRSFYANARVVAEREVVSA